MTRRQKRELKRKVMAGSLSAAVLLVLFLKLKDNKEEVVLEDTPILISDVYQYEASELGLQVEYVPQYESYLTPELKANLENYLGQSSSHTYEDLHEDGVTSTRVNLRKGPDTEYDIIEELGDEVSLQVLGVCDNDWYAVNVNGKMGFVCGDYLRVFYPGYIESQTIQPTMSFLKAVEATTGVNVRDDSNSDTAAIIGGLSEGQRVSTTGRLANGWYKVDYNGTEGYVCGDYVKEVYASSIEEFPLIYIRENAPLLSTPYGQAMSTLNSNQFIRIYGENDDYYLVNYNGSYGYVRKNLCERMTDTYAIVDISDQTLKIYRLGEEIFSTSVVTGKDSTPTDIGFFSIYSKERNAVLRGADYASPVDYWMPFNGGEGLHDASWRSNFGGDIYHNSGSHGCVNLPVDVADDVYDMLSVGDRVFVKE